MLKKQNKTKKQTNRNILYCQCHIATLLGHAKFCSIIVYSECI